MSSEELILPEGAVYLGFGTYKAHDGTYQPLEMVAFDGIIWRRHPAKKGTRGKYFYSHKTLLHRRIYERFVGPIPEGMQVHHINGYNDNRPEALMLISTAEHTALHQKLSDRCFGRESWSSSEKAEKIMAYHASEAGQKHHSRTIRKNWKDGIFKCTAVCVDCGKEFTANISTAQRCPGCKKEHRRALKRQSYHNKKKGVETPDQNSLDRVCVICGKHVVGSSTTKYCEEHKHYWKRPGYVRKKRGSV